MNKKWIVESRSGTFIRPAKQGEVAPDGHEVVEVKRDPEPNNEKYSGDPDPDKSVRPVTTEEINAIFEQQQRDLREQEAKSITSNRPLMAVIRWVANERKQPFDEAVAEVQQIMRGKE